MNSAWDWVGVVAAVAMPLFNIPLILKIRKRRSSADISLTWVLGVWACIVLMLPSAIHSADVVLRVFGWVNATMFTLVVAAVIVYRKPALIP